MKTISMFDFRRNSERVIRSALAGERMLLTYRGKFLLRREPCIEPERTDDDPFYHLGDNAGRTAAPLPDKVHRWQADGTA